MAEAPPASAMAREIAEIRHAADRLLARCRELGSIAGRIIPSSARRAAGDWTPTGRLT